MQLFRELVVQARALWVACGAVGSRIRASVLAAVVAVLALTSAAVAQSRSSAIAPSDTVASDATPQVWGTVGIGPDLWYSQHSAYMAAWELGVRGGIGMRVSPRFAMRIDASVSQMWAHAGQAHVCIVEPVPGTSLGCPLAGDQLGNVVGSSVSLAYLTGVIGGVPSTTLSLGPALYYLGAGESWVKSRTALAATVRLEQTIRRDRENLWSLDVGAVMLPGVEHDVVWQIPVGLGVRFW